MSPHACASSALLGSAGSAEPARFAGGERRSPNSRLHPPKGAATSLETARQEVV